MSFSRLANAFLAYQFTEAVSDEADDLREEADFMKIMRDMMRADK